MKGIDNMRHLAQIQEEFLRIAQENTVDDTVRDPQRVHTIQTVNDKTTGHPIEPARADRK